MKIIRLILTAALCASAILLSGCSALPQKIGKLNDTLKAIDTLGVKRVEIPGRATHTTYVRDGNTSTLTHTNPALAGPIVIVRERTAEVTQ